MPKQSKAVVDQVRAPDQVVSTAFASEIASDASIDGIRFLFDQLAGLLNRRQRPIHGAQWLPPTLILVGAQDPLYEDSQAMHARLDAAGIRNELVVASGVPHGYIQMEFFGDAGRSIEQIAAFFRRELAISHRTRALRLWLSLITTVGDSIRVARDVARRTVVSLRKDT